MIKEAAKRKQRFSSLRNKLHPAGNSGLTLMELVIVLALMVLVIGMVYSFFYFINNSFHRGGDQFQLQSNISTATEFISGEIRNATEIEIVEVPITADPLSQYIYVENNTLKHRNAGTVTDKSERVISSTTLFTIRENGGRYYITIDLQGKRRDEDYSLSADILLNNISNVTGTMSGNAIRYKR